MLDRLKSWLASAGTFAKGVPWAVWFGGCCLLVGATCGGCTCSMYRNVVGQPQPGSFGWVNDPAAVAAAVATMPQPKFATAGLTAEDKDALLYQAALKVLGHHVPPHDQDGVGCCVGEGYTGALEYLQVMQIAAGQAADFKRLASESVYALSRHEVGKDRLKGDDGSVGAWAAVAVTEWGCLPREKVGSYDLSAFDPRRAKSWGDSGLPDDLEPTAAKYKAGRASKLASAEEARVALTNGYPVAICSGLGFSMTRDSDGFCRQEGQWGHCMACAAYRSDRRGFLFVQSWGPSQPKGPLALDQPPNSFWVTWQVMERVCQEGDTFALSQFAGFPRQNIDNFVRGPRKGRGPALALSR